MELEQVSPNFVLIMDRGTESTIYSGPLNSSFCLQEVIKARSSVISRSQEPLPMNWRTKMGVETSEWDPVEFLDTEEKMALYLEVALEENDAALVAAALGDIARAKGMSQIALDTGLGRESLYKALSSDGNPSFATILRVVSALGLRLQAAPRHA
jgi:probable addiction module antidote protein